MPGVKKRYIVLIAVALITAGGLIWVRSYIFEKLAVDVHDRIQSLNVSGFSVRYDSIRVDWIRNILEIDNLILEKDAYDTTCVYPEFISIPHVRIKGISLLQLIFRNVLSLESIQLDRPRAVIRQNSLLKPDSTLRETNEFTLKADYLYLRAADFTYTDSASCKTITHIQSHVTLSRLRLDLHRKTPFAYATETLVFDSTVIKLPRNSYTFTIRQAKWNSGKRAFRIDSVNVIPDHGKLEFARKHGFEIDRYECLIPSFAASGLTLSLKDSLIIRANLAEVQFKLKVFRDKRLRFIPKKKLLPTAQLRELPFFIAIDSMKVLDSFVQYEEFIEDTPKPGGIFFDNLNAVLRNINNMTDSGSATMQSRAKLFGQGQLTLFATFPYKKGRRSSVAGSIRNFNLPKLNPILTPSTQIEVKSGEMKELSYNFTFDEIQSDGEIALNYEDLKVVTFKEVQSDDENGPEKDNLKTFMMNTFVFKKNMTEDMPEEKRTGTILFLRDDTRSVFNFWTKSLVSGIKSAYNIDKAEAKKSNRELKKEERLSKRELRRQRKAEKKRERG